jgi:hypothetical protein
LHKIGLAAPTVIRRTEELAMGEDLVAPLRSFPTVAPTARSLLRPPKPEATGLVDLALARPGVRTADGPLAEVVDRVARVRHLAWSAAKSPNSSADLLRACAAVGTLLNDATLICARQSINPRQPTGTEMAAQLDRAAGSGDAWRSAHRVLAHVRTPTPGGPALAEEVRAIRMLLKEVTAPTSPLPTGRSLTALSDAATEFGDVAGWNASALDTLRQRGLASVAGAGIPSELTAISARLTHLRLTGGQIPIPGPRCVNSPAPTKT